MLTSKRLKATVAGKTVEKPLAVWRLASCTRQDHVKISKGYDYQIQRWEITQGRGGTGCLTAQAYKVHHTGQICAKRNQ